MISALSVTKNEERRRGPRELLSRFTEKTGPLLKALAIKGLTATLVLETSHMTTGMSGCTFPSNRDCKREGICRSHGRRVCGNRTINDCRTHTIFWQKNFPWHVVKGCSPFLLLAFQELLYSSLGRLRRNMRLVKRRKYRVWDIVNCKALRVVFIGVFCD